MLWWWTRPKRMRTQWPCRASPHPPRAFAVPLRTMTHMASSAPATTHHRPASAANRLTIRPLNSPGRSCTRQSRSRPPAPCLTPSPEAASTAWGEPRRSTRSKATPTPKACSGIVIPAKVRPHSAATRPCTVTLRLLKHVAHVSSPFFFCSAAKLLPLDNVRGNHVFLATVSLLSAVLANGFQAKAISINALHGSNSGGQVEWACCT